MAFAAGFVHEITICEPDSTAQQLFSGAGATVRLGVESLGTAQRSAPGSAQLNMELPVDRRRRNTMGD